MPFSQDWTIERLIEQLSHDDSTAPLDATQLTALARVEAALSEQLGLAGWSRTPSVTALLRSIVQLCASTPALRALTVGQVLERRELPVGA